MACSTVTWCSSRGAPWNDRPTCQSDVWSNLTASRVTRGGRRLADAVGRRAPVVDRGDGRRSAGRTDARADLAGAGRRAPAVGRGGGGRGGGGRGGGGRGGGAAGGRAMAAASAGPRPRRLVPGAGRRRPGCRSGRRRRTAAPCAAGSRPDTRAGLTERAVNGPWLGAQKSRALSSGTA